MAKTVTIRCYIQTGKRVRSPSSACKKARATAKKLQSINHFTIAACGNVLERSKDNSVVIYQTDKSGRFSIDTAENYLLACEPHVKGDETITQQDYERLESEMNAHSVIWARILGAGHGTGHVNRIKNNMITHDCPLAPLYTLRKDHKAMDDEVKGPPVRPVCGAVSAYNQRLSYVVSKILNEVWKEEGSVCISTEDTMAGIKKVNDELRNNVDNEVIVGSADVKALYPNLDVDFTVDICEGM